MTTFSLPPLFQLLLTVTFFAFVPCAFAAGVSQEAPESPRLSQEEREALLKQGQAVGDEKFELYLSDQKVGTTSMNGWVGEREGKKVLFIRTSASIHASINGEEVRAGTKDERIYELAGEGRLIAFSEERSGDDGDEKLTGRCTPDGIELVRTVKGKKPQTFRLPPTRENIDRALALMWVLKSGKPFMDFSFDAERMADRRVTTSLVGRRAEVVAGVETQVSEILHQEEDHLEKFLMTPDGRTLEVLSSNGLMARLAPQAAATSALDSTTASKRTVETAPSPSSESPASHRSANAGEGGYRGSKKSKEFHKADCKGAAKIEDANMVTFATRKAALASGRKPASDCKP